jgi:DNA-directed RNA polymerase subunit RPC12/RpoP
MAKSKEQMVNLLWCPVCNNRPKYLIKGYSCPDCGSKTIKKEVYKAYLTEIHPDEKQNPATDWLDG